MLESLFYKIEGLKACSFIKKRLQRRYFSVKFANFLRTPILKNICKRLPLNFKQMLLQIDKQKGRDKIFLRFNAGVKVIGLMVKFLEEKVLFSKIIEPKDLDLPLLV